MIIHGDNLQDLSEEELQKQIDVIERELGIDDLPPAQKDAVLAAMRQAKDGVN